MILSIHQPVYLPGVILFNKIALSDRFMFLSNVSLSKQSWQTRNRIRSGKGEHFLSVPVRTKDRFAQSILDVEIPDQHWRKKHLKSIYQAYASRPFFKDYFPQLEAALSKDWTSLCDLNISLIRMFLQWLNIDLPILDSRDYKLEGNKNHMLIGLCGKAGADAYISNVGSAAYIDESAFVNAGIVHYWQSFTHPVYNQGKEFLPNLCIIDLVFNTGQEAGAIIRECGTLVTTRPVLE